MPLGSKYSADRGKLDVADLLAVEIEKLQLRRCVLFILRKKLSTVDGRALQHGVRLRDEFFPVLAIIIAGVGDEDAIARRVFVGRDVELAFVDVGARRENLCRW